MSVCEQCDIMDIMVWGHACIAVSPGLVYSQHLFVAKVLALSGHDI